MPVGSAAAAVGGGGGGGKAVDVQQTPKVRDVKEILRYSCVWETRGRGEEERPELGVGDSTLRYCTRGESF